MPEHRYTEAQLEGLSLSVLEDLRERFEATESTTREDYPLLVKEIARKRNPLVDYDKSLTVEKVTSFLRDAASRGETVTYKGVTDALGCEPFSRYRWPLIRLLDAIFSDCATHGSPILTAIVMAADGLTDDIAVGFAEAARRAGMTVGEPRRFFEQQRARVFEEYSDRNAED